MRNLKQFHSAEKLEREEPLGFLKLQLAAAAVVVPSGFVSYVKN